MNGDQIRADLQRMLDLVPVELRRAAKFNTTPVNRSNLVTDAVYLLLDGTPQACIIAPAGAPFSDEEIRYFVAQKFLDAKGKTDGPPTPFCT